MKVHAAGSEVFDIVVNVKNKHHLPRLEEANIAIEFRENKPFTQGRFNFGKTTKFSPSHKLWQEGKYDFLISLCEEAWHILAADQREALIDLRLNCCQVEYQPEMQEVNGKQKPAKDKWGRIIYTDDIMYDDDGIPKWKVIPPDLHVIQDNVVRYGCWCADLVDLQAAIKQAEGKLKPEVMVEY